eukprot:EG_transcript_877
MALDFSDLSLNTLTGFVAFVADLVRNNTQLVDTILWQEKQFSTSWAVQITAQMSGAMSNLVNYTTNVTAQNQAEMTGVLDTFSSLLGSVVSEFRGLAGDYAAQRRQCLAAAGSPIMAALASTVASNFQRLQQLVDLGLLTLARRPSDPVGEADCTLLAVLCNSAAEVGRTVTVTTVAGRFYSCGPLEGGTISSVVANNGSTVTISQLWWHAYNSSTPDTARQPMKQRCMAGAAVAEVVSQDCAGAAACRCGADPRCAAYYRQSLNSSASSFRFAVYANQDGSPYVHLTMPLTNATATPPAPLAVVDQPTALADITATLAGTLGVANDTFVAMLLNDSDLTVITSGLRQCAANETPLVNSSAPLWSGWQTCDPGLLAVVQWLAQHRDTAQPATLYAAGLVWDVTPVHSAFLSFFLVVASNLSQTNQAIDATDAAATAQVAAVRQTIAGNLLTRTASTQRHVTALLADNIQITQGLQHYALADLESTQNATKSSLDSTQRSTEALVQDAVTQQQNAIAALKAHHLNAMSVATGWTLAIVATILLAALLCSAWGTRRITQPLLEIIDLMEEVAALRVEDLVVPHGCSVAEVARIQNAFEVLVHRLTEYKSYIPAGLFDRMERDTAGDPGSAKGSDDDDSGSGHASSRQLSHTVHPARNSVCPSNPTMTSDSLTFSRQRSSLASGAPRTVSSMASGTSPPAPPSPNRRSARRGVAVLAINAVGFADAAQQLSDGLLISCLNDYVTCVHEAVTMGRGNLDCVLGDQLWVTFNAHLPCGDPASAAAAAALEVQRQLLVKVGARMRFQIAAAHGVVLASSIGYARFKSMVTVGIPMKVASLLSHLPRVDTGTILVDSNMEDRLQYSHNLRPLEFVHLVAAKASPKDTLTCFRVSTLLSKKQLQEDEWMYQVGAGDPASSSDWTATLDHLSSAKSPQERDSLLHKYLASHPHDDFALRLKDRLALWVTGSGIPL